MAPKATGRAVAAAPPEDELPFALLVPVLREAPVAELPVDVPTKLLYELPAALCSLARLLACAFNDVWSVPVAVAATEEIEAMTDDCEALRLEKTLEKFWPDGATMIPLDPEEEIVETPLRIEESGLEPVTVPCVSVVERSIVDGPSDTVTDTDVVLGDETTTEEVTVADDVVSDTTTEEVTTVEDWSRDVESAVFEISVVGCCAVV
ncbi:hypothetical protein LTR10_006651 [Elasticomyces elasticus]|nr:hypothetical protein LTR10_006651 [Elasticomyces elasticus]KAK4972948.1 hypothetical protein LTR42_006242 [Elasticomyces elasticus]